MIKLREFFLHESSGRKSSTNIEINVEAQHPLDQSASRYREGMPFEEWFALARDEGGETLDELPHDELAAAAREAWSRGEDPSRFVAEYTSAGDDPFGDPAARLFGVHDEEPESEESPSGDMSDFHSGEEVSDDDWGDPGQGSFLGLKRESEDPSTLRNRDSSKWSEPKTKTASVPDEEPRIDPEETSSKAWQKMRDDAPEQTNPGKLKDFFGGDFRPERQDEASGEPDPETEWVPTDDELWDNPFPEQGQMFKFSNPKKGASGPVDRDEREDEEPLDADKLDKAVSGIDPGAGSESSYCDWCGEDFVDGKPGEEEDGMAFCNDRCLAANRADQRRERAASKGTSRYEDVPRSDVSLLGGEEAPGEEEELHNKFNRLGKAGNPEFDEDV